MHILLCNICNIGEQRTSEEVDRKTADGEEITEMISSCKGVFRTLLERHFPVSDRIVFYGLENMNCYFGNS